MLREFGLCLGLIGPLLLKRAWIQLSSLHERNRSHGNLRERKVNREV